MGTIRQPICWIVAGSNGAGRSVREAGDSEQAEVTVKKRRKTLK